MSSETAIAEPLRAVSPEHLGRLMLGSFRFSQGGPTLQTRILEYVTHDLKFVEDDINAASTLAEAQALALLARDHEGVDSFRTNQELVTNELNALRPKIIMMIRPEGRTPREELLPDIFSDTLYKDKKYADLGRRFVGTPDGRYFSYFVRYAMLATPTGSPEYNEMYTALRDETLDEATTLWSTKSDLDQSVAAHAQVHPDDIGPIQAWWDEHVNWPLALPDPAQG